MSSHQASVSEAGFEGVRATGAVRAGAQRSTDSAATAPAATSTPSLGSCGAFGATLLVDAVIFLSVAAAVTVALYVTPFATPGPVPAWWTEWKHVVAPLAGVMVAFLLGISFAGLTQGSRYAEQVDAQGHGQLFDRLGGIDARLRTLCPLPSGTGDGNPDACQTGCAEARAHRDAVVCALSTAGARWILGSGFNDAWRRLHAAEQALFLVDPKPDLIGAGLFDELRLKGSTIRHSEDLTAKLRRAVIVLGAADYLTVPTAPPTLALGQPPADQTSDQAEAQARAVLRDVRRIINDFRDEKWDALIRARNRLVWTGAVTAISGFVLLTLAILVQVPDSTIIAAIGFYLVGATVGLFNQLRLDTHNRGGQEDFGFAKARVFHMPVLSGLAAVGGVIVVAALYTVGTQGIGLTGTPLADDATGTTAPSLAQIFDLSKNGFGLLFAAVFGLTPDLLVDRLQQVADRYRTDLQSTTAQSGPPTA